jgi:hypothetical protein
MNYLDLVVDPLNQELVQSRGNPTIGVNPIATNNNTIITLHLDDEERNSERLAPYSKLHGDDASSLHRIAPHVVKRQVGLHELVAFPPELFEDRLHHQVDDSVAVDEHPRDRPSVDVNLERTMASCVGSTPRASRT